MVRAACLWLLLLAGCGRTSAPGRVLDDDFPSLPPPAACATLPCSVEGSVPMGADGRSDPFAFTLPDGARSIAIEVVGADARLYALASLVRPDGTDLVALPPGAPGPTMRERFDDVVARMPGALYQTIRLGTFAHVYPYAPGLAVPAGTWSLRVASDAAAGEVSVRVIVQPDDAARTLHLNLITVTQAGHATATEPLVAALSAIYAQAGLGVTVDGSATLASPLATIDEPFGTIPGPSSELAQLARAARPLAKTTALDVLVIDGFSANAAVVGESLGAPGPVDAASYYWAALVTWDADAHVLAHRVAHEVGHFLGLQHPSNTDLQGMVWPDPLEDTDPSVPNLMNPGADDTLTANQAFVLQRSPLLDVK